jgi:hypothetical protein
MSLLTITCKNEQFSFGGMPPSANILRTIENVCGEDEVKMQQSFNGFDKCSGISESAIVVFCSILFTQVRLKRLE